VVLTFDTPLAKGDYQLIVKGTIGAVGRRLDGNGDGLGGDDYIEQFTVTSPPLSLNSAIEVVASDAPLDGSRIAVNPVDRSYVVVWQGLGQNAGETDIYANRFDVSGGSLGTAMRVNTFTELRQIDPSIAMDKSGNYVIVWSTEVPLTTSLHVVSARRFAADGSALDTQFEVGAIPTANSTRPSVAMDSDGDFVIAWQANGSSDGYGIYAQRFDKAGLPTGPQIPVNSESPAGAHLPHVAMDASGNFFVTWLSPKSPANETRARWFSATSAPDNEFTVNTTTTGTQDSSRVAMNRNGELAVVWRNTSGGVTRIYAQRYDRERRPIGAEFQVNTSIASQQSLPDIAIDADGNLAFSWIADSSLHVRWFDKWGNLLADEFAPLSASATNPRIGMAPVGGFFVTWVEPEGAATSVKAQRFTLEPPTVDGVALGPDGNRIVVAFSQEMATSGAGSVREPSNWALRFPNGRYLVQADPTINGTDPRATPEQFTAIPIPVFDSLTGRWKVTLTLNTVLVPGEYQLIARSSLQDAAGRRLDGNGDGVSSERHCRW
jgi:hypothetical protein